jgi:hypothetical protein
MQKNDYFLKAVTLEKRQGNTSSDVPPGLSLQISFTVTGPEETDLAKLN